MAARRPTLAVTMGEPAGAPPYVKAMWHYARGAAFAEKKDVAAARNEAEAIGEEHAEDEQRQGNAEPHAMAELHTAAHPHGLGDALVDGVDRACPALEQGRKDHELEQ